MLLPYGADVSRLDTENDARRPARVRRSLQVAFGGQPRRARTRYPGLAVTVALTVLLVGGCSSVHVASPLDDARAPSAGPVKRCSPSDPNRSDWFCKVGQLLYNVFGARQVGGSYVIP